MQHLVQLPAFLAEAVLLLLLLLLFLLLLLLLFLLCLLLLLLLIVIICPAKMDTRLFSVAKRTPATRKQKE